MLLMQLPVAQQALVSAQRTQICPPLPSIVQKQTFSRELGENHRTTQLRQVCGALEPEKAAAMAALHGLSGSDNTGCLAGKGNFWNAASCK